MLRLNCGRQKRQKSCAGFTLIEMLVGLTLLAVLALISWRGLDALLRVEERSRERAEAVARLQTSLAQWRTDLDASVETGQLSVLDFDGRVLRLTRRDAGGHPGALRVVGWARRAAGVSQGGSSAADSEVGQWLRWQSPPLYTSQALQQAWAQAATWAQTPSPADRGLEVQLVPLVDWQLFYFRNNGWSNPLSSEGSSDGLPRAVAFETLPDAVRLVLVLPSGVGLAGRLSQDWLRPTFSRSRQ